MQYQKIKSVAKLMQGRGEGLQNTILKTLQTCSDLVGSTLGPGGMSVVIEHQEPNMAPIVTKDGVTVFRSLGFEDSTCHVLMESARDAAVRTASEAGDGTTTATILAEAFVRYTMGFCNRHPHISPQRVSRLLQHLFETRIEPGINGISVKPGLTLEEDRRRLHAVARISANGDTALADAVMKCFDIIGSDGNVTITENTGTVSKYDVEKIEGYPIPIGYEDSCGPFYQKFINDPGTQQTVLEKPSFILYHGKITDFNTLYPILSQVAAGLDPDAPAEIDGHRLTHNVVVVATGFSETVLANLAAGFVMQGTLNVYPLRAPVTPSPTGQYDFLLDIAGLTGATVMDPLNYPLQNFQLSDLGLGPTVFEASRFRSNIVGRRDDILVLERVAQIEKQLTDVATSDLMKNMLRERVAKMTSGIARLVVHGSSHGEIKERRDRAEDAVCAVRGALRHGILPGGGAVLAYLSKQFQGYEVDSEEDLVMSEVMAPALLEPVKRLYGNAGYTEAETKTMIGSLGLTQTYDVLEQKYVDPWNGGILDSTPAVREALRNSISIAALLGTCGGTVVFRRDTDLERTEARDTSEFLRNAGLNEANERG